MHHCWSRHLFSLFCSCLFIVNSILFWARHVMVKQYHNTPKMKIRLCLWSWILGNDRNGVISTYNDRETGFLRRVRSVTLREKLRSSEIHRAMDAELLLIPTEGSQPRWFSHVTRMTRVRLASRVLLTTRTRIWPRCRSRTRWRDYLSDLASSGLDVEPADLSEVAKNGATLGTFGVVAPSPYLPFENLKMSGCFCRVNLKTTKANFQNMVKAIFVSDFSQ